MVWSSMTWRKGAGRCFSHVAERSSEMHQRCEWLEMWYSNAWQQQFPGSCSHLAASFNALGFVVYSNALQWL